MIAGTEQPQVPATRIVESPIPFVASRRERGRLSVVDGALHWNGAVVAQRGRLSMAYVVPPIEDEPATLHITELGAEDLVFEVRLAEGRELLVALEQDPARSVLRWTIPSMSKTWPTVGSALIAAPIVAMIGTVVSSMPWKIGFAWAIPFSLLVLAVASLSSTHVRVSGDAIEVRWLLFHRRIALRDLRGVERIPLGLRIDVSKHRPLELRTAIEEPLRGRGVVYDALAKRRARRAAVDGEVLFERIEQARRAYALPSPIPFDASVLQRAGRSVDEWISHLRALRERPTENYRNVAVDLERVWELALDPRASTAIRAAALVVIAPSIDAARERRLRSLSRGLLDEPLRRTIDACLARDEAAMRDALDAFA